MFKLHVYSRSGDIDQQVEVEGDEALIGRSGECHVVIDRKDISRVHARLIAGWVVDDLGSRNGTHVDGRKIADATRVGTRCFEVGDPSGNNLVTIEVVTRDGRGQAELTESGAGVPEPFEREKQGERTTVPLPAEPDVAPSDPEHEALEAEMERYRTQCARLEVELEQLREKFEHVRRSAGERGGGSQADENKSLRERVERLERELRARSPKG